MRPVPTPDVEAGRPPVRVLLLEAEAEGLSGTGDALGRLFESRVEVELAVEVNKALDRLSLGGIDLLLLDLDLPDDEDLGTFERIRLFSPDVPIVVLTRVEDE